MVESFSTIGGAIHTIALPLQDHLDGAGGERVVFDNEDTFGGIHRRTLLGQEEEARSGTSVKLRSMEIGANSNAVFIIGRTVRQVHRLRLGYSI
jgi:hypothetical protein